MCIDTLKKYLEKSVDSTPEKVSLYFKTGSGSYGEFDQFLGITTPTLRKLGKRFSDLSFDALGYLLLSKYNEERLLALIILVNRYQKGNLVQKNEIFEFYARNLKCVNNWNLVDNSAHHIMGAHLFERNRKILMNLAFSRDLWERRIAIVATWYFIKRKDFKDTFKIAEQYLKAPEDLIHKATGWMLREVGKQDQAMLEDFLEKYTNHMPRTTLRYAIERFDTDQKKYFMAKPLILPR